ncbi:MULTISPECIES: RusA family crossover junction endodeoxyribonuclease [Staphylococcus]|uniref:RusA family crossover junction endodeoxyribonuclease n=1 Tax=Staphylococcus TaxID=1279 RepID=UPI0021A272F3|nr:RusA family crossover junction endodeoxyribonuclease [Staphylococcus epidermidis]MCT1513146.1 RusA family crossover junction endodeoxyribonuclease [Staphylococcus epidermidis]
MMEKMVKQLNHFNFTVYVKAVSSGRPFVNKNGGVFDSKAYRNFKENIDETIEHDIGDVIDNYRNIVNEANGFKIKIRCGYQIANSQFWGMPKITRPDADNTIKPIFDQVLGRLGIEDSQIFNVNFEKVYANENYIEIDVTTYEIAEYHSKKKSKTSRTKQQKNEDIERKLKKIRKKRGFI